MSCCLAPYRRSMVTSPWGFPLPYYFISYTQRGR